MVAVIETPQALILNRGHKVRVVDVSDKAYKGRPISIGDTLVVMYPSSMGRVTVQRLGALYQAQVPRESVIPVLSTADCSPCRNRAACLICGGTGKVIEHTFFP